MSSRIRLTQGLVIAAAVTLLTACHGFVSSRDAVLLSDKKMQSHADVAFDAVRRTLPAHFDQADLRYVECVGNALFKQLEAPLNTLSWRLNVFQDSRPIAFALPMGQVGLSSGLLDTVENQHQLAAIIAHELGHIRYRHSNERITTNLTRPEKAKLNTILADSKAPLHDRALSLLGLGALDNAILPYERRQESEADLYALDLMAKAGFHPRQALAGWLALKDAGAGAAQAYIGTHPVGDRRAYDLTRVIETPLAEYGRTRASGIHLKCR